jgi:phage shock protein A
VVLTRLLRRLKILRAPERPADPIRAYDALLEDLQRQSARVREAAATLLSARAHLEREIVRRRGHAREMSARAESAGAAGDSGSERVLRSDVDWAEQELKNLEESLARTSTDADELMEQAKELADRTHELRRERQLAAVSLNASTALAAALRARVDRIDRVLAVDRARDEVERAHALAQIYREEMRGPSGKR